MSDCPVLWQNFVRNLQVKNNNERGFTNEEFNFFVKEYNAIYFECKFGTSLREHIGVLEFKTDAGFTLFTLHHSNRLKG